MPAPSTNILAGDPTPRRGLPRSTVIPFWSTATGETCPTEVWRPSARARCGGSGSGENRRADMESAPTSTARFHPIRMLVECVRTRAVTSSAPQDNNHACEVPRDHQPPVRMHVHLHVQVAASRYLWRKAIVALATPASWKSALPWAELGGIRTSLATPT